MTEDAASLKTKRRFIGTIPTNRTLRGLRDLEGKEKNFYDITVTYR